jgi:lipopolysaccharide export system protein LptA
MRMRPLMLLTIGFIAAYASLKGEADEMIVIDSGLADYDGKKITLSGEVQVDHELGKISANYMELIPETSEKKTQFHRLRMKSHVKISLKDGGVLTCSTADVDYRLLQGRFFSGADQEFVIYAENCDKNAKESVPLLVKSKTMTIKLLRDEAVEKSPHSQISEILADDQVTVHYNNDFVAIAEHATYQRNSSESVNKASNTHLPGLISLRSSEGNGCQVTNRHGDLIQASRICIDTIQRFLLFAHAKGTISANKGTSPQDRVNFSSDTMIWDSQKDVLTLRENVVVNQPGIGTLNTDKELKLFQHVRDGVKNCVTLKAQVQRC